MFKIKKGRINKFYFDTKYHHEGWWWLVHKSSNEKVHSPESPFLSKEYARRYLTNTLRARKQYQKKNRLLS